MKMLLTSAGLAMMIISMASCKKDHTCICFNSQNKITHTYTYGSTTREEARDFCAEAAMQLTDVDSLGETYICTLE
jgi:hypothetical protein